MHPLISVVVPVYNRAHIVTRMLESVRSQSFRPLSLVLVDNNSSDSTRDVLERWAADNATDDFQVTVASELRPGAAVARNTGLQVVTTPWTMFFDSDDTMDADHLQRVADFIMANPDCDLVGWDVMLHNLDGSSAVKPFEPDNILYNNVMHGSLSTQRYAARTELFRDAGGWGEDMRKWDDIELGVRILLMQPRIIKLKGSPKVHQMQTEVSITGMSYMANVGQCVDATRRIKQNLPEHLRYIANIKLAILAARCKAEIDGDEDAETMVRKMLDEALADLSPWRKTLLRLAYLYTRCGGRGAARLLRPLM